MSSFSKKYMLQALAEAKKAATVAEVPVGAIICLHDEIIATSHNLVITNNDPTAHAEILAIRQAAAHLQSEFLSNCTLYVTLEPCHMCAYAISLARIDKVVFGAYDEKKGAITTGSNIFNKNSSYYKPEIIGGILEEESAQLLKDFFQKLR